MRLGEISVKEIRRGKSPSYDDNEKTFAFAQKCNTKYHGIDFSLARSISDLSLKKYGVDDAIKALDIVVNSTGTGTLGRVGIIGSDLANSCTYYSDSHVTLVRVPQSLSCYVYLILKNYEKYFEESGEGSTNQKELKPVAIQNTLIPLPPPTEQKRIVNLMDNLMQKHHYNRYDN